MTTTTPEAPAAPSLPDISLPGPGSAGPASSPVVPVAMMLAGGYLMWFAIHYWRDKRTIWPSDPVKDVLQGHGLPRPQRAGTVASQVGDAEAAAGPGQQEASGGHLTTAGQAGQFGGASGTALAKDAASYEGKVNYVLGGADPATGWDCSGLVNYTACHDIGLDIPGFKGGTFTGKVHGPTTSTWPAWPGTEPVPLHAAQAGDIVIWPTHHMGIVTDPSKTQFVSAENPTDGTRVDSYIGFFATDPIALRFRAIAAEGSLKGNQAAGALLAGKYGWSPSQSPGQWAALVKLWTRESGWSVTATNPTSGAYGIAQALPPDKYASAGSNWRTSAVTQIRWGLGYIKDRYGSPEAAWAHETTFGWY
jgi:cell wall-associated NlpC family hydrolase